MTDTYDFVHVALFALGGSVQGKTKLQKLIYFIGVMLGKEQELGYRPHYYGPYSSEVADAMDTLLSCRFVKQSHAGGNATDHRGFEVVRTDYELTDDGRKMAEKKAAELPCLMRSISEASKVVSSLKSQDYMKLSIAAKTYFMLKDNPGSDPATMAPRFGWEVSGEQIKEARKLLAEMNLANKLIA